MDNRIKYNDCIVFLVAKANQNAQKILKERLKKYGLTTVQGLILGELFEEDGVTASDIGNRLVLDNATVSGVLDRLLEKGWITKETDEKDKRVQKIFLSSRKDNNLITQLFQARKSANDLILSKLTIEEQMLLKRFLRDLS
ncbi:MAG: MarR family transcriptional regulator [Desulfobacteraceae bacterium]|jgi:DNA-binding MarR family transcriptional regulator